MYQDKKAIYNHLYVPITVNIIFICIQIYGLLFQNWSGLYIVYLFWVELIFLFIHTLVRFTKLRRKRGWDEIRKLPSMSRDLQETKDRFKTFVFFRVLMLALYFGMMGFCAVALENGGVEVSSAKTFFKNMMITDPVFLVALFALISYYIKTIVAPLDESLEGKMILSIDLEVYDLRYFVLLFSPFLFGMFWGLKEIFFKTTDKYVSSYVGDNTSPLYMFAIVLIIVRFLLDLYLTQRVLKKIKASRSAS